MRLLAVFRTGLGIVLLLAGGWLFLRDYLVSMRKARRDFPGIKIFFAIKNVDVGCGFWLGLGTVILGVVVLTQFRQ